MIYDEMTEKALEELHREAAKRRFELVGARELQRQTPIILVQSGYFGRRSEEFQLVQAVSGNGDTLIIADALPHNVDDVFGLIHSNAIHIHTANSRSDDEVCSQIASRYTQVLKDEVKTVNYFVFSDDHRAQELTPTREECHFFIYVAIRSSAVRPKDMGLVKHLDARRIPYWMFRLRPVFDEGTVGDLGGLIDKDGPRNEET